MAKQVALYLRVSTDEQTLANQRRELTAAAERHGWQVVAEFSDAGISGSKGRDQRRGFDRLMQGIARREFDMVAAWSVDRLSRSLSHLVAFLGEIHGKGIDLYLHTQGLDTSTPTGKAMFHLLGVFAELERSIVTERINAGIARAKAAGKHCGRPRVSTAVENRISELLRAGVGIITTARKVGVGTGTVQRVRQEMTG
ncbi:MAG: recombinase family protein, partial [Xanthobacteraceae bacterium]